MFKKAKKKKKKRRSSLFHCVYVCGFDMEKKKRKVGRRDAVVVNSKQEEL